MNWDPVATEYSDRVGETGDYYHQNFLNPATLKLLGNVSGKKVLDLACGNGYFSRQLVQMGAKVMGVDISAKLIQLAEEQTGKNLGIKYLVADSADLRGIEIASQDIVVSNMGFHDIERLPKTVAECARVLASGGQLIFSITHPFRDFGERVKDEQGYYWKLKQYGREGKAPNKLYSDKGMVTYHRPIEYYLDQLLKNNFTLTAFQEVYTAKPQEELPDYEAEYRAFEKEIPSFLVVGAKIVKS
jgi:ubiquinone/menaquinone biosynthesis C-methylase UbiE